MDSVRGTPADGGSVGVGLDGVLFTPGDGGVFGVGLDQVIGPSPNGREEGIGLDGVRSPAADAGIEGTGLNRVSVTSGDGRKIRSGLEGVLVPAADAPIVGFDAVGGCTGIAPAGDGGAAHARRHAVGNRAAHHIGCPVEARLQPQRPLPVDPELQRLAVRGAHEVQAG